MFAIPFGEIPPEMKAEIERRHQLGHMAEENARHEENRFFDSLDQEQLQFLDRLIGSCMVSKKYASYIRGRIDGLLLARDQRCPCGKTHEAPEDFVTLVEIPDESTTEVPHSSPEDQEALMEEYGMELVDHPDRPGDKQLRCANCKMPSASMEDRMLRAPKVEGCNGCQIKEGHG